MLLCLLKNKNANQKHETREFCEFLYPPSYFCVYFENKNAYLKQETSEIVVKSIHHGGLLFNCIKINLKSSENKERWRLSTVSIGSQKTSAMFWYHISILNYCQFQDGISNDSRNINLNVNQLCSDKSRNSIETFLSEAVWNVSSKFYERNKNKSFCFDFAIVFK